MNYSAQNLFSDWYKQGVKREVSESEFNARIKAINTVLSWTDVSQWFALVKLFCGIVPATHTSCQSFTDEFKKEDDAFPLRNNEYILRLLAGCVLAQKIETNADSLNNALALAILTSSYNRVIEDLPLPEILEVVQAVWLKNCEEIRRSTNDILYDYTIPKSVLATKADVPTDASGAVSVTSVVFNTSINKIQSYLASLFTEVKAVRQAGRELTAVLQDINKRLVSVSEESNVIWWLYNSYNQEIDKSFIELGLPYMCINAPKEMAALTVLLPGLPNYKALLYKALITGGLESSSQEILFSDIIESVGQIIAQNTWIQQVVSTMPSYLNESVPCIQALRLFEEYKAGETWQKILKQQNSFNATTSVKALSFAQELYQELILVRVSSSL